MRLDDYRPCMIERYDRRKQRWHVICPHIGYNTALIKIAECKIEDAKIASTFARQYTCFRITDSRNGQIYMDDK